MCNASGLRRRVPDRRVERASSAEPSDSYTKIRPSRRNAAWRDHLASCCVAAIKRRRNPGGQVIARPTATGRCLQPSRRRPRFMATLCTFISDRSDEADSRTAGRRSGCRRTVDRSRADFHSQAPTSRPPRFAKKVLNAPTAEIQRSVRRANRPVGRSSAKMHKSAMTREFDCDPEVVP